MRRTAFFSAIFPVLFSSVALAGDPAEQPSPPKRSYRPIPPRMDFSPGVLEVDNPDFDWGSVLQGEKVRHDYILKNVGGYPVTISAVRPSCGCTVASFTKDPIAPGKTGTVTLEISTKGYKGAMKKSATVQSNAKNSTITIYIGGKVETPFTIQPPDLGISVVRGDEPKPLKVTVSRNPGTSDTLVVKQVRTDSKIVKASVAEVKPGELYEVTVVADLGADQRKYFYEKLTLDLEVGGKPMDSDLQVRVEVKDRIEIQPKTVYFAAAETRKLREEGAQPLSRSVEIVSLGGPDHTFRITGVTTRPAPTPGAKPPAGSSAPGAEAPKAEQPKFFETKVEPIEPGKKYRLTVLMKKVPEGASRTVREVIAIQTDDPMVPEITLTPMAAVY